MCLAFILLRDSQKKKHENVIQIICKVLNKKQPVELCADAPISIIWNLNLYHLRHHTTSEHPASYITSQKEQKV